MRDTWLAVGPVDELAEVVANIIIADPAFNADWIAKWQARPKELFEQPYATLTTRDDITDRLGEITCPGDRRSTARRTPPSRWSAPRRSRPAWSVPARW